MGQGRPRMTGEQRELAVTLLANAIRQEAHLRARAEAARREDLAPGGRMGGRRDASARYVQGMRDLLAMLFADGRTGADACYAAARAAALGEPEPSSSTTGDGAGRAPEA